MIDYKEFVSKEKSMLIAPAGFGKTYTISECLIHLEGKGKQLILTHTHAGVASLKEKFKQKKIHSYNYNIETITSFAQKYVLSFYTGIDIPSQENSKEYYPFIINKAKEIFKLKLVKNVISRTYSGLFVDEYQDCTTQQHELISSLADLFPTHILGDYLQGIFGFNGEALVDMQAENDMLEFINNQYSLNHPQRWLRGNNSNLGLDLKKIRESLIKKEEINLSEFPSIETFTIDERDLYIPYKDYYKEITKLLKEENLLILHPDSTSIYPRLKLVKQFNNRIKLIESIDDKDFYKLAKTADEITNENIISKLNELSYKLFNKTELDKWFNEKGFKKKREEKDRTSVMYLESLIEELKNDISYIKISFFLIGVKELQGIKSHRSELFSSFVKSLREADENKILVSEAMTNSRNVIRRTGRKVSGRCIGTTLLTKGLEFDTVAIINAHKFKCPKHLYVALTRASKRLLIFTNKVELFPYK
ncbi:AAA family ATPase [Maribacter sp. BPC-D8]|uniref:UvrD-helicase domain-containing protein n=1 Tax=Maribacter sp. BPC-D8 TaxID=3053613 RepID=UPI002B47AA2E|nr:UvrD-helicase domain-containing protein [Maribacter sp. BPC-D8]WRI28900.1 AAA family ATPase [Maribacter sp. BPC-D8]